MSGTSSNGIQAGGTSLTFAHNNVAGDYLVLVVESTTSDIAHLSATYNGVSMSQINGENNAHGTGIVALFGLAGPATGSHNVVVSCSDSKRIIGIAQSFVNVHQTTPPTAAGGWSAPLSTLPPYTNTVSSATNHMVVDGVSFYSAYGSNYRVNGGAANTAIGSLVGGGSNSGGWMSYAPGAASVAMGWTWDYIITGHGHGMYTQNGNQITNGIAVSGNHTFTAASGDPWRTTDIGSIITIAGAGVAGADLVTTIDGYTNYTTIHLVVAPSTSVNPATATWGHARTIKDNIFLDQVNYCLQTYGSSGAAYVHGETTGNLFLYSRLFLGGLWRFLDDRQYVP